MRLVHALAAKRDALDALEPFPPGKKRGPKPNKPMADATLFTQKQEYDTGPSGPYVDDNQRLCNGIINSMQINVRTTSTEYLNYLNQEQLYNSGTIAQEIIDPFQVGNAMINSQNAGFNHEPIMILPRLYSFVPFILEGRLEHSEYQHDNLSLAYNSDNSYVALNFNPNRGHSY
ncbi:28392_t:CDS:2 [Dentiscutata erythropus]|uniref:28392_t:CDS:1 n=1 Tax=Dentiscutata erythropus TaxID=1348616 RepID=A0A9N8YZR5_9GLOM|nr:28392_t:CDS:2 [Dentiscutata erythropus]